MDTILFSIVQEDRERRNIKKTYLCLIITIIISCLLTAIAQGSVFFYSSHYTKILVLACLSLIYIGALFYLKISQRLDENRIVFMMILLGVFMRCG